jgi:hypothetical protein
VAFPRIRSERVAGLSGASELNIDLNGGRKSAGSLLLCPPLMSSVSGIHIHRFWVLDDGDICAQANHKAS